MFLSRELSTVRRYRSHWTAWSLWTVLRQEHSWKYKEKESLDCHCAYYKISGLEPKCPSPPPAKKNLPKSLHSTLESSSIQTTEPIVKCHTNLEMRSHDVSAHTFRSSIQFLKDIITHTSRVNCIFCHPIIGGCTLIMSCTLEGWGERVVGKKLQT